MNIVHLSGNIGKDPELKDHSNGVITCRFTLATNKKVKGDKVTQWHNITAFGKIAELVNEHFGRGDKITITGELEYYKNNSVIYTNVVITQLHF